MTAIGNATLIGFSNKQTLLKYWKETIMGQDLVKINRIASSENVIQFLQSLQPLEKLPQKRERNLKQRALLNKYPDPAQFILDYNPDLQFKLVRCNATHSELALNDSIPSLGLLSSTYGDETPIEWLKIQFGSLNDFAEVSTKIAKEQLSELSEIFLSEYYYINAAEICFFIARFKSGKYGRFYGSIDPLKITSAMLDYVSERRKDIERKERERYRNQREKEIEERGDNRISYAEYIEIKHRADAGDEEARKMLISP
nr:MAG TPA: hypothetical protein [Caudoviricetes sp.]DAM09062.1 MAG TPA: hypothetical protein [Caudoviricetes sp.]DAZ05821.1 MAG TPA: hypothetical protein [Caudoviricetes sp.]DAZ63488.1 MAG TPA: hypothetical protein [Caudoviricetes sp.]